MSVWTEILTLAAKWVLVNMNSQEWLIVKDQRCFPNVLAQLTPTHTISTCFFFNRQGWGWALRLGGRHTERWKKNLKDHVSYDLNSFSSLMFFIIVQQLVFLFFSNCSTEFGNILGKVSTCSLRVGSKLSYAILFYRGLAWSPLYWRWSHTHHTHRIPTPPPHTPTHTSTLIKEGPIGIPFLQPKR